MEVARKSNEPGKDVTCCEGNTVETDTLAAIVRCGKLCIVQRDLTASADGLCRNGSVTYCRTLSFQLPIPSQIDSQGTLARRTKLSSKLHL